MTKSELIARLAERFPQLVLKDPDTAVNLILETLAETLVTGNRVEIRGFGSFALNYRPPRTGRNPKTGEKVAVPGKWVPHFKAGKELRERIDLSVPAGEPVSGLMAEKREQQARSRAQLAAGERSQESMFLIDPETARTATVRHRVKV